MDFQAWATLGILALSVGLFLSEKIRPDLVAMATTALLAAFGVVTPEESFSGFSSGAIMVIISVFILAEGLYRSGISEKIAGKLTELGNGSEPRLVALFMGAGAFLSLFMNNIASASVLIPSAGTAARKSGISVSKLLIPLVYATILGGMATVLTTMNIVVGSVLEENGLQGFSLLDFIPVGIPAVAAGILFMVVRGRKLLPSGTGQSRDGVCRSGRLFGLYGMNEVFFKAKIAKGSVLAGRTLSETTLREDYRLSLATLSRRGRKTAPVPPDLRLREGDTLILKGSTDELAQLELEKHLRVTGNDCITSEDLESDESVLVEVMLSPRSSLVGSTLRDVKFLQKYGMHVLAIWRENQPVKRDIRLLNLRNGDALLGLISRDKLPFLRDDPDLISLTVPEAPAPGGGKALLAFGILAASLLTTVFSGLPISQVLFAGAVLMLLSGVLSMEQAYRAINWRAIFIVAGMLPMALALQRSGLAGMAGSLISSGSGSVPLIPVAVLFLFSALMTQAVTGAAVAAVMAPIAATLALEGAAPAHALGIAVALGSSMAFLTPLGHPVNILVMGAGSYSFSDYRRVGAPLFALVTVVILTVLTLRWGLLGS